MWLFVLEPGILKWQLNYLKNDFLMSVCQMFRGKNFIILYSPLPLYSPNQHYCCLYFFGKISYLCHLIGTSISTLDSYSLLDKPKYSKGVKFALQKGMQHLISQVLPDLSSDMDGLLIFWLNIHNWSRLLTGSFPGISGSRCRVLTAKGQSWPYLPTQVTL